MSKPTSWAIKDSGVDVMEHVVGNAVRLHLQGSSFVYAYVFVQQPVRENVQDVMWPAVHRILALTREHHILHSFVDDVQQTRGGAG